MDIVRENGKIWGITKDFAYGVWHYKKTYLGEDNEEKPKEAPKKKKTKKGEDN